MNYESEFFFKVLEKTIEDNINSLKGDEINKLSIISGELHAEVKNQVNNANRKYVILYFRSAALRDQFANGPAFKAYLETLSIPAVKPVKTALIYCFQIADEQLRENGMTNMEQFKDKLKEAFRAKAGSSTFIGELNMLSGVSHVSNLGKTIHKFSFSFTEKTMVDYLYRNGGRFYLFSRSYILERDKIYECQQASPASQKDSNQQPDQHNATAMQSSPSTVYESNQDSYAESL